MFLNKNYISANELSEIVGISYSVITKYRKEREYQEDFLSVVKLGGMQFVDLKSHHLPESLKINPNVEYTVMTNKLPYSHLKKEHELNHRDLKILGGKMVTISNAKMWVFNDDFVKMVTPKNGTVNTVTYILDDEETLDCFNRGLIKGYIPLSKETKRKESKNFVWYFV